MRRAADVTLALAPMPAGAPRQRWLFEEIRSAIAAGRLAPGARLPTSRDLARTLGLSRATVVAVFDQLAAEGYVVGRVGRGSFVSDQLPEHWPQGAVAPSPAAVPRSGAPALSARGAALCAMPAPTRGRPWPAPAFRPHHPDLDAFPFDLWNRIAGRRSRLAHRHLLAEGDALGLPALRDAIADHLRLTRGLSCSGAQVAVVGSIQQAIDLLARLLLDPGDAAWMEDPGYPGARLALAAAGARVVGVPVDEGGLDVAAGRALAPGARLAYVTAGRHTPLGMPLALERRLALLAWADEADAILIEDDYDSEFRFEGAPLAAMKSLDAADRVVYAGTFSKMLFPALRLAFVVLPDCLVDPFAGALALTARFLPTASQAVLHAFIAEGHFGRHLRRMRLHYAERAEALTRAVGHHLAGMLSLPPIAMGLDAPAFLPAGSDGADIARRAGAAGLETRPLSYYAVDHPVRPGLMLGFAAVPPAAIAAGVERLARVIEAARGGGGSGVYTTQNNYLSVDMPA